MLITIYARKEPTRDRVAIQYGCGFKKDVVFYKDVDCKEMFCIWPWHLTPPTRARKTVVLNCFSWAIQWVDDLVKIDPLASALSKVQINLQGVSHELQ